MKLSEMFMRSMCGGCRWVVVALVLGGATSATGTPVTIAEFRFTGNSAASSDSEPLTSTSDITQGAGITGTIFANFIMIMPE